jgi:hypothetical protein
LLLSLAEIQKRAPFEPLRLLQQRHAHIASSLAERTESRFVGAVCFAGEHLSRAVQCHNGIASIEVVLNDFQLGGEMALKQRMCGENGNGHGLWDRKKLRESAVLRCPKPQKYDFSQDFF